MAAKMLDTSSLIDIERGFPFALAFLADAQRADDELLTCDIIVAEYYSGRGYGEMPSMDRLLAGLRFVVIDFAVALTAADYRREFARRGIQLTTMDTLIAAAARSMGATLVTHNMKDFPMTDLSVFELA